MGRTERMERRVSFSVRKTSKRTQNCGKTVSKAPHNPEVAGSSPAAATTSEQASYRLLRRFLRRSALAPLLLLSPQSQRAALRGPRFPMVFSSSHLIRAAVSASETAALHRFSQNGTPSSSPSGRSSPAWAAVYTAPLPYLARMASMVRSSFSTRSRRRGSWG